MQKNPGKECIQINVCWFVELEITEKKNIIRITK
jgi:hypothetical protein